MTLHDGGKDNMGLDITNIESVRVNYGVLICFFSFRPFYTNNISVVIVFI